MVSPFHDQNNQCEEFCLFSRSKSHCQSLFKTNGEMGGADDPKASVSHPILFKKEKEPRPAR